MVQAIKVPYVKDLEVLTKAEASLIYPGSGKGGFRGAAKYRLGVDESGSLWIAVFPNSESPGWFLWNGKGWVPCTAYSSGDTVVEQEPALNEL